ncbi:hypothetical protein CSPAE12_04009 [Colletotrichum incanum]|nr:hypothetical protein CSPAE12_04009 [Colletotrichum incanum]
MMLMGFTDRNGSFHYSNPNGSTYSNNGNGGSTYTSASGYRTSSGYGKNLPAAWTIMEDRPRDVLAID